MDSKSRSATLNKVRHIAKRARGDVRLTHELGALRRDMLAAIEGHNRGPLAEQLASLYGELAEIRQVTEATLRGVAQRGRPFDVARPAIRRRFEPPRPWMAAEAVEHVTALLGSDMRGLEWGGGASTPYWCEHLGILHTFEADRGFALLLIDFMSRQPRLADRWRLHFVPCNWASTASTERKKGAALPTDEVKEALTRDYATLLSDPIDAIFVDGSVREATLDATAKYIDRDRPLVIVIDNTDADYVRRGVDVLDMSTYTRSDYTALDPQVAGGQSTTSVFVRK